MGVSRTIAVASALLILAGVPAEAQAPSLEDGLQSCARLKNPMSRLNCFDRLAKSSAEASGQTAAKGDSGAKAPPAPAQRAVAESKPAAPAASVAEAPKPPLTATEQRAASERRRAEDRGDRAREGYDAVVLRAWQSAKGDYYVALTNGEIWKSEAHDTGRPVKEGEAVQLQPAAVGSWFMQFKTSKRPGIRVSLLR